MCCTSVIAIVALFLPLGESQVSLNPPGMLSVCPNTTAVFTCRVTGSSILLWTSTEYIGPNPATVAFASSTMEGMTKDLINGGVAELTLNSGNVLESELRVRATVNSSISCLPDEANNGETVNLTVYNGSLGRVMGIGATQGLIGGICITNVKWDPPANTLPEDIRHYIVSVSINGVREEIIPSTNSTLVSFQRSQCIANLSISVSAVDRCGREGPSVSIMADFLPPVSTPNSATTDFPSGTTIALSSGIVIVLVVMMVVLFVLLAIIMLAVVLRSRRKTQQSTGVEEHDLLVPKSDEDDDTVLPWKGYKKIYIKFFNVDLLASWTINDGQPMNTDTILRYANKWSDMGGGKIPCFVEAEHGETAQIRCSFNNKKVCNTQWGKRAQNIKESEPTMNLDLHNGCPSEKFKQNLIIQIFGHALGLSYEHQRFDVWKRIKPFTDTKKMKRDLGMTKKQFANDWKEIDNSETGKHTEKYDPDSIMHVRFKVEWLTKGYSDKATVERDRDSGKLIEEDARALLDVHKHRWDLPTKPSPLDIQLLKELYGDEEVDIFSSSSTNRIHLTCQLVEVKS